MKAEHLRQLERLQKMIDNGIADDLIKKETIDHRYMAKQGIELAKLQSDTIDKLKNRHRKLRSKIDNMMQDYCTDQEIRQRLKRILVMDELDTE